MTKPRKKAAEPSKVDANRRPQDMTVRSPSEREQNAINAAREQLSAAPVRPSVKFTPSTDGTTKGWSAPHDDFDGHIATLKATLGSESSAFLASALITLSYTTVTRGKYADAAEASAATNAALALVASIEPQNELEASLAIQMASTNALTTEMLGRARHTENRTELESYTTMGVKLARTFTAQVEALAKLRSGGKQQVEVRYIYVDARGSQNVLGDVHAGGGGRGGGGGRAENGQQPHARAFHPGGIPGLPAPHDLPLRREDEEGDPVPLASDRGAEAMPDARRQKSRGATDEG